MVKKRRSLNKDFEKNLKHKFANPRNAASGSLRQKNPEDTKRIPLKFIAYTFGYVNNMEIKNQSNYLQQLSEWGFKTNPFNKTITVSYTHLPSPRDRP